MKRSWFSRIVILSTLTALMLGALGILTAHAAPICYVKADAAGLNNGSSWTDAYVSLQSALNDAACTEIWAAAGTYKPTDIPDRGAAFQLKNGVALYGGFSGDETARAQRHSDRYAATILSGDLNGDDGDAFANRGENSYHVVIGATGATLDGFAIQGGNANGSASNDQSGGGMDNNSSSPTVANVTFSGNQAIVGGGMFNYSSSPTVTNVAFSGNQAYYGGGMHNRSGSSPTVMNVTFSGNQATYGGGGMYNDNSSPTVTNAAFSGNGATDRGGGMCNKNSSPTVTNVTFSGNGANSGGGMYNLSSSPTLKNVILSNSTRGGDCVLDGSSLNAASANNLVEDVSNACGLKNGVNGNIVADPLFVDADGPDNLGGTADDDLRLDFGSPAIDAGTNAGCPAADLDGLSRPGDGNGDTIAVCDMGAYEGGQMICGVSVGGEYSFPTQSGVVIQVTTLGPNLGCLYVDEMEINHPAATSGLKTGRYWRIRGLQSNKSTPATEFIVTLTLPAFFTPDAYDKVCHYTGSGQVWDCAVSSFGAASVVRAGVSSFSDWAVGNDVGPTRVSLRALSASALRRSPWVGLIAALGLAALATILLRKARSSGAHRDPKGLQDL